jgi:hypothetical protein
MGIAALSFLGTITGKLSWTAAALKFCRRHAKFHLIAQEEFSAGVVQKNLT